MSSFQVIISKWLSRWPWGTQRKNMYISWGCILLCRESRECHCLGWCSWVGSGSEKQLSSKEQAPALWASSKIILLFVLPPDFKKNDFKFLVFSFPFKAGRKTVEVECLVKSQKRNTIPFLGKCVGGNKEHEWVAASRNDKLFCHMCRAFSILIPEFLGFYWLTEASAPIEVCLWTSL